MNNDRTNGFFNDTIQKVDRKTESKTSDSVLGIEPYSIILPANINVFSGLSDKFARLENREVMQQVALVILYLYQSLQEAYKYGALNNYLSRMNLIQQDDKAALLEWNFQDFRVGFTLEPIKTESSYFMVSQDKSTSSFRADTQKLDADISRSIGKIVTYVLENT